MVTHPRHPEITLALPSLLDDERGHNPLMASHERVADCFQQVL